MALNLAAVTSFPQKIGSFLSGLTGRGTTAAPDATSAGSGLKQLYLQIAAFILFAALAFWVINQVRVNGPVYNDLKQQSDLIADSLPPSLYPVDAFAAYNEAYVASTAFNNDKRDKSLATAKKFEALFAERSKYWAEKLTIRRFKSGITKLN